MQEFDIKKNAIFYFTSSLSRCPLLGFHNARFKEEKRDSKPRARVAIYKRVAPTTFAKGTNKIILEIVQICYLFLLTFFSTASRKPIHIMK